MSGKTTFILTEQQAQALQALMENSECKPREVPYARYSYAKPGLSVTVYEKGNKLLVQGKEAQEWIEEMTGFLTLWPAEEERRVEAHFGIDESGKGDYFGPLVIAGVYADASISASLRALGVCDSKLVASHGAIRKLAEGIRGVKGIQYAVVSVGPERYNQLYEAFENLNKLLAWGHVRVMAELAAKQPSCKRALSDQFARPDVLKRELTKRGVPLILEQRTKAESDLAVAAASILARERFVNWMEGASKAGKVKLPLGASSRVIPAARELIALHGREILPKVAKLHFKTTAEVLKGM